MYTFQSFAFSTAILILMAAACGPQSSESRTAEAGAENEEQIRQLLESSWEALASHDRSAYTSYTTPEWRLYTVMGNKLEAGRLVEIHQENITGLQVEMSDLNVHLHNDLAWATYDGTLSGYRQGEEWGGEFIFTTILQRHNGEWRMVHKHESMRQ